jgi:hypothetical protein
MIGPLEKKSTYVVLNGDWLLLKTNILKLFLRVL